jgi:flagellar hook-basal body complex protein FliE
MTPLTPIVPTGPLPGALSDLTSAAAATTDNDNSGVVATSFTKTLSNAFDSLNSLQINSEDMTQAYANHQTSDLHSVMIASEEASIALQLATQVRNKVVEAYQEIEKLSV